MCKLFSPDIKKKRRLGSIERSCVEAADSLFLPRCLVGFTKSRPRIWTLDTAEPEIPSVLGQSPDGHVVQHAHASHVFIDSQIFKRIAKQKQEVFWEVLNLLLYWRIGCSFVNWFYIHRSIKIFIHHYSKSTGVSISIDSSSSPSRASITNQTSHHSVVPPTPNLSTSISSLLSGDRGEGQRRSSVCSLSRLLHPSS